MLCFLSLDVWFGGVDAEKTMQGHMGTYRTILKMSWKNRATNQEVLDRMNKQKEVN